MRVLKKTLQSSLQVHAAVLLACATGAVSLACACGALASSAAPVRAHISEAADIGSSQSGGQTGGSSGGSTGSTSGGTSGGQSGSSQSGASASLVQCMTASSTAERSATFSGEMTALPGTTRMAIRIEVLERGMGEADFHTVLAPGLGVWRAADPGVKVYKLLKQVANLSAPAVYRAAVAFRWLGSHGRPLRRVEHLTHLCHEPLPPTLPTEVPPSGESTGTGATQPGSSTPSTGSGTNSGSGS